MKKLVLFFLATMLLGSCADEVVYKTPDESEIKKTQMFSYDSVTNPNVWKTFMTFEEMMNATQIPENILKTIPTDTLVALCMNHPLGGVYMCYNNHLKGALSVIERFNGFQELMKRKDAGEKLISFYEALDIDYNVAEYKQNPYSRHLMEVKPLKLGFSELVIASKKIEDIYSPQNINRLENVINKKYEDKLRNIKYNKVSALGHSLLISAQVKMTKSGREKELTDFIDRGGSIRSEKELTEISRIIYSK